MIDRRPPPGPPQVLARTLKVRAADAHLLRRLGQAMVLHWDELPDDLQDLLIDQAAAVEDNDDKGASAAEVESFIRTVKTAALAKAPTQAG